MSGLDPDAMQLAVLALQTYSSTRNFESWECME